MDHLTIDDIAHDLKSPLTTIKIFVELLSRQPGSDKSLAYVKKIDRKVNQLTFLINAYSDLLRLEESSLMAEPQLISLDQLLASTVNQVRNDFPDTTFVIPQTCPAMIHIDPQRFSQVLTAILIYCHKHQDLPQFYFYIRQVDGEARLTLSTSAILKKNQLPSLAPPRPDLLLSFAKKLLEFQHGHLMGTNTLCLPVNS